MQTYQSQCNQPKRKLAYLRSAGMEIGGKDGALVVLVEVAEASFPSPTAKPARSSMHAGAQRETVNALAPHYARFCEAQQ